MELEVLKKMFREKGLKMTNQRMLVLEIMAERPEQHLTAEEIYDLAKKEGSAIGLSTIYRTVQVLVDLSVIDKVSFDDGFARYELGSFDTKSKHHHHHAICSRCHKVFSFKGDLLEPLEQALIDRSGFYVTNHEVKLFGYCRECRRIMKEEKDGKSQDGGKN
jgi:Fur family ferric uptake transcriptional regulator